MHGGSSELAVNDGRQADMKEGSDVRFDVWCGRICSVGDLFECFACFGCCAFFIATEYGRAHRRIPWHHLERDDSMAFPLLQPFTMQDRYKRSFTSGASQRQTSSISTASVRRTCLFRATFMAIHSKTSASLLNHGHFIFIPSHNLPSFSPFLLSSKCCVHTRRDRSLWRCLPKEILGGALRNSYTRFLQRMFLE